MLAFPEISRTPIIEDKLQIKHVALVTSIYNKNKNQHGLKCQKTQRLAE